MLEISDGVDHITGIRWELAGCLLLAWIVVYCALWRGIKSIGKVPGSLEFVFKEDFVKVLMKST